MQLHRAGYKSLSTIASANPEVLMLDIDHLSRRQAQQIVASAKVNMKLNLILKNCWLTFDSGNGIILLYWVTI